MVIGLTGKFCTGKNRIGSIMETHGWDVIEVDHLGHGALINARGSLVDFFGDSILSEDGTISRKKLGDLVFDSPAKLAFLESVLHPVMKTMCHDLIKDRDKKTYPCGTVLNAAILHKMGLNSVCDSILYVKASVFLRFFRAKSTRAMTTLDFLRRERVQHNITPEYFFDVIPLYVIMNNHGDTAIKRQLESYYKSIGLPLGDEDGKE